MLSFSCSHSGFEVSRRSAPLAAPSARARACGQVLAEIFLREMSHALAHCGVAAPSPRGSAFHLAQGQSPPPMPLSPAGAWGSDRLRRTREAGAAPPFAPSAAATPLPPPPPPAALLQLYQRMAASLGRGSTGTGGIGSGAPAEPPSSTSPSPSPRPLDDELAEVWARVAKGVRESLDRPPARLFRLYQVMEEIERRHREGVAIEAAVAAAAQSSLAREVSRRESPPPPSLALARIRGSGGLTLFFSLPVCPVAGRRAAALLTLSPSS